MYYFSEMNSPHKNDKKFAQMFVLPDLVFFFFTYYSIYIIIHPSVISAKQKLSKQWQKLKIVRNKSSQEYQESAMKWIDPRF